MALLIRLINYMAFYGVWCLCLLTGSDSHIMWALPVILIYLVLHLVFISTCPRRESILIAVLTVVGAINESFLSVLGVVSYAGAYFLGIAWWTLALWACFATTYWHAFSWLSGRPFLAAILGALAAPMCYASVEKVGGISFPLGFQVAWVTIAAVWAIVLPATFAISQWICHFREKS